MTLISRYFIVFVSSILVSGVCSGTESSSWNSFGKKSDQGESFEIPFKMSLKGEYHEGKVILKGSGTIQHKRLNRYFKMQQMESQSLDDSDLESQGTTDFGAYASLLKGGFKLLKLSPLAPTSKVTVAVYMGEESNIPHLEAIDVRLNPFKRTPFDIVYSSFMKVDLRDVKVEVSLVGNVAEKYKDEDFEAEINGFLIVGDFFMQPESYSSDTDTFGQGVGSDLSF